MRWLLRCQLQEVESQEVLSTESLLRCGVSPNELESYGVSAWIQGDLTKIEHWRKPDDRRVAVHAS